LLYRSLIERISCRMHRKRSSAECRISLSGQDLPGEVRHMTGMQTIR